jgi:hypothetical protein
VGARFEPRVFELQALRIERTLLELRDVTAGFADHVMVVVLSKLVTRPVAELEASYDPELEE